MSKYEPSKLAVRLAAERIFVEIVPERRRNDLYSRGLWWQRPSTRVPLEQSMDKILADEFNAKFDHLRTILSPLIENCVYCSGSGRIERGVDNQIESADCSWCFPFRETLRLLPSSFPVKEIK